MRNKLLFQTMVAAVVALGFSLGARAQSNSQKPAPQQEQKPAAKTHKVWTSDDLGTLRSPADLYLEKEQKQADEEAAAAQQAADSKQAASPKPAKKAAPPRLSNPKTPESADEMIAWEDRDIQAQTEYLAQLKQQLAEAPPEDKARLEKLVQERVQILAGTRQEREGLAGQKKELQKKLPASASAQSTRPPQ
jgi:hypothetical protein